MAMASTVYSPVPLLYPTIVDLTDGANIATDASRGSIFRVTFGGNRTMTKPTNGVDGQTITYWITNNGSRTVTWGTGFIGTADVALPTLTSGSTATDRFAFSYRAASDKWEALAVDKGAA